MRQIVFIAHDPGSCDVLHPVYIELEPYAIFLAMGPSVAKFPMNAINGNDLENVLQRMVDDGSLAGVVMGRDWETDLDVRLLSWTRQHRVKSVVILDYWSNYASSFRDSEKQYWPDAYLVMDEMARQEAVSEGVPDSILKIVGHPGLDKFCAISGRHNPDRDVLFVSQPLSLLYGDSLGYTEQNVLADVLQACLNCDRKLDVKFHPKDEQNFQARYQDIAVSGDVDELMKHYKLVVGMNSMALLHAALMQIPIISYQPGLKGKDGCITNRLGLSRLVGDYKELLKALSDCIQVKTTTKHIWLDGRSAKRASQAIKEILN